MELSDQSFLQGIKPNTQRANTKKPVESFGVAFIDPQQVIDTLDIKEGMIVADFGCGTGYFSFPLSKSVGPNGKVFALDILKEKLEAIESQAKILSMNNIVTKRVNLEVVGGSKLEESSVDWVFLVNMLFQNKFKRQIFEEVKRVLKKGGKVLVVEWNANDSTLGPSESLRVSKDEITSIGQEVGLSIIKEQKMSDYHFGIILEK